MLKKNDFTEIAVTDLSNEGVGVGKTADGLTVFVPDTAIGDRVKIKLLKVKKTYAFGKVCEVLSPSPDRIAPDCSVFGKCGGCVLRHINYEAELNWKQNKVFETMKRLGGVESAPKDILFAEPQRYRNKAQYPVSKDGIGFYAQRSHRVICTDDCLLEPTEFSSLCAAFGKFIKDFKIQPYDETTKKGLVRHLFLRKGSVSGEIGATVVINGETLPHAEKLPQYLIDAVGEGLKSVVINKNTADTNVILGDKNTVVFGREYITDTLCGVGVKLSPHSFYQVNHAAATLLYNKTKEYAAPCGKVILDLYCGTGTIGLSMQSEAKEIIGVEIVPEAVEDAMDNAKRMNAHNCRFICGDAAMAAETLKKDGVTPDTVILDPPRKGCPEQLLETVAKSFAPKTIVYVSCDVATLARDCKTLSSLGYTVKEYTPVDMFPRTAHVETVALLVQTVSSI